MSSLKVTFGLLLTVGLAASNLARADVWGDYNSATEDMIKALENSAKDGARDANSEMTKLDRKATALSTKLDDETADVAAQQAKVNALNDQHAKFQAEIDSLNSKPKAPNSHVLFWTTNPRDREIKAAQRQMADLDLQVKAESDTLTKLQSKQSATAAKQSDELKAFTASQTKYDAKYAELQAKVPLPEAQKLMLAHARAKDLIEKQRANYFDSKFLGTDLALLQQKNKLSGFEVQAMKDEAEHALDNTLIGNYVQRAIAGTCDADFQKACAAGKADALNYITSKLVSPPPSASAKSSDNKDGAAAPAAASGEAGDHAAGEGR